MVTGKAPREIGVQGCMSVLFPISFFLLHTTTNHALATERVDRLTFHLCFFAVTLLHGCTVPRRQVEYCHACPRLLQTRPDKWLKFHAEAESQALSHGTTYFLTLEYICKWQANSDLSTFQVFTNLHYASDPKPYPPWLQCRPFDPSGRRGLLHRYLHIRMVSWSPNIPLERPGELGPCHQAAQSQGPA